ncbi:glycosyl hydrolase family 32 [Spongisporangium articulatum]|uniref:beta-fructofuranosidase n=1 Tax=Spongisporangium articulatum TaxID=3362603 RepID=A0ABW8ALI7_9ACTN
MLRLDDAWVWDSWPLDTGDGGEHHLFFLRAPRSLAPDDRHWNARIGHAVSPDLETWRVLPDALHPSSGPAFDDLATWTGSVVRGDDGTWNLFYSAVSRAEGGRVQRIGRALSDDLLTWHRDPRQAGGAALLEADPRWYETRELGAWREEAWRDPWVFRDPGGDGWHMLITARLRTGRTLERGTIGHARSADLLDWEVQPPLTAPAGFGQLEVAHTVRVDGRWVLVFCCLPPELDDERRAATPATGMWSAPAGGPLGPFDLTAARPLADPTLYAAHLVTTADGPALIGFRDLVDGAFVGEIDSPVAVRLAADGALELA